MKKELEQKLVEKYPEIFKYYDCRDPIKSLLCFGFECGDGWFNLIDELCYNITKVKSKKEDVTVIACQVKEKFGLLRFYYDCIYKEERLNGFQISVNFISDYMYSKYLGRIYWFFVRLKRLFYKTTYEKIHDLVNKAELKSGTICEDCGNPGKINSSGWRKTLCEDCRKD